MLLQYIVARYSLERLFCSVLTQAKFSMSILLENIYTCHFDLSILIIEFNLLNAENLENKTKMKKKIILPLLRDF